MFNTVAYMTRGFQRDVPFETQLMIFGCMDKMKRSLEEVDYLQVFTLKKILSNETYLQEIVHTQEIPLFKEALYLTLPEDQIITTKIFVIDDGDHHTFLLASEY